MHVFESALHVGKRSLKRLSKDVFEERVLVVQITNGTQAILRVVGRPYMGAGRCEISFDELGPGQTGKLQFSSGQGMDRSQHVLSQFVSNAKSGCHHAGAVEFLLGEERLLLGESNPLGQRFGKSDRFILQFAAVSSPPTLDTFYARMPQEFVGESGTRTIAAGECFNARSRVISCDGPTELDVVLLDREAGEVEFELESLQQLHFLEWCMDRRCSSLSTVLFLSELGAVMLALSTRKLPLADRAFTLDLLIHTFVLNGDLEFPIENLNSNLQQWIESRHWSDTFAATGTPQYADYVQLEATSFDWESWIDAARLLLRAAAWQCTHAINDAMAACKSDGAWPVLSSSESVPARKRRSFGKDSLTSVNADFLAEHLRRLSHQDSTNLEEHLRRLSHQDSTNSEFAASSFDSEVGSQTPTAKTKDLSALLHVLVRHCVHISADYAIRREAVLDALERHFSSDDARNELRHYRNWLSLAHRQFMSLEWADMPEIRFEAVSMDVLGSLDGGRCTAPQHLKTSLGYDAPEYKVMSTNSKSGEIFLFSGDRKFIIKTVSAKEYELLSRVMPAYRDHIRSWPRSLIVRFAGLYHVQVPGALSKYFIVMSSIFDPQHEIHETFDLKGSLVNRKKKPGEGIGKDEDWISSGNRLALPVELRREICAAHEMDVMLLNRFRMMDYSLLVGIHHVKGNGISSDRSSAQGITSESGNAIYFMGIIDFSIKYSLKKETETLFNVAKGAGENASCVCEDTYAMRQTRFIRDMVVRPITPGSDMGTRGLLRVDVLQGHDLVAADWIGTSDPYVRATLGMLSRATHAVQRTCNPTWQTTLFLPVNDVHVTQHLELVVWDEDRNRGLRGSDDFIGKLLLPMDKLIFGTHELRLRYEKLSEVDHGSLSVNVVFEPLQAHAHCWYNVIRDEGLPVTASYSRESDSIGTLSKDEAVDVLEDQIQTVDGRIRAPIRPHGWITIRMADGTYEFAVKARAFAMVRPSKHCPEHVALVRCICDNTYRTALLLLGSFASS